MVHISPTLFLVAIALSASAALAAPTQHHSSRDLGVSYELSGRALQYFEVRTNPSRPSSPHKDDKKEAAERAALQAKCQAAMAQIQQGIKISEALAKMCKDIGHAIKDLASRSPSDN